MDPTTITIETLSVWAGLAVAMWLAMTMLLTRAGSKRAATIAAAIAALLSWLVARATVSLLPVLLDWISRHSGA